MGEEIFRSETHLIETRCGNFYLTLCFDEKGNLKKTFFDTNELTACQRMLLQVVSRLISLCIQNKVPLRKIIEELKNQRCNNTLGLSKSFSCPHAIASILEFSGIFHERKKQKEELTHEE